MKYLKLLLGLAVLAAWPALAFAHRAPTRRERAAIVSAFDRNVHEPVPAKCLRIAISTANASWAEAEFGFSRAGRLPAVCAKFAANGKAIFHHRGGRWRWVTSGSDFHTPNGGCAVKGVPHNVVADFKLC